MNTAQQRLNRINEALEQIRNDLKLLNTWETENRETLKRIEYEFMKQRSDLTRQEIDKTLILVTGNTNKGKTTIANLITPYNISADDYPLRYAGGVYNSAVNTEAHQFCMDIAENWMSQSIKVVAVHNLFYTEAFIQPYRLLAEKYSYALQVIQCKALELPGGRIPDNGHKLSADKIQFIDDKLNGK